MRPPIQKDLDRVIENAPPPPRALLPPSMLTTALPNLKPEGDSDEVYQSLRILLAFRRQLPEAEFRAHSSALFALAHGHPDPSVVTLALDVITGMVDTRSYIEHYSEGNIAGEVYTDDHFARYAKSFKINGGDSWQRDTSLRPAVAFNVCEKMEGFCLERYQDGEAGLVVDRDAVWLFKHNRFGQKRLGSWNVLVNLTSGEVYTPGTSLTELLLEKLRDHPKPNPRFTTSELKDALGSDEMRIHFRRLIHTNHILFARLRRRILGDVVDTQS